MTSSTTTKLDGCYVIKTDVEAARAPKERVHERYKDLAEVEWAFRTAKKSFLETQPVYVRCEKSTRGHVLVVMLAYMIVQALSRDWAEFDLTVEEGLASLATLCTMHLTVASTTTCNKIPEPNDLNRRLLEKANVTVPAALPHRNVQVATRKKLAEERARLESTTSCDVRFCLSLMEDPFHGFADIAVSGQDRHSRLRISPAHRLQHVHALLVGHVHVEEDHIMNAGG